ncbi:MAG: Ig-like domain-containing protein [Bacteroidia bacterium]
MRFGRFLLLLLGVSLHFSCANVVPPTGGERDTVAPELIKADPPNGSLFFSQRYIRLDFNEYIRLQQPNNIRVTPALDDKPTFTDRFGTLYIDLGPTPLRDSTTYTINFGEVITDLNEGNKLSNFRYVFSTGHYLDSLIVGGVVLDAEKMEPMADILVGLYPEDYGDSAVFNRKPFYFIKTTKDGKFSLENLKAGVYTLLAFDDKDNNQSFKLNEPVAYLDTLLVLDTVARPPLVMRLFEDKEANFKLLEKRASEPGLVRFKFSSQPADSISISRIDSAEADFVMQKAGDSVLFHHRSLQADSLLFAINYGDYIDSVKITNRKPGERGLRPPTLRLQKNNQPSVIEPMYLELSRPIGHMDTASFVWTKDTVEAADVPFEIEVNGLLLTIKPELEPKKRYELYIPPAAVRDWFDMPADTFRFFFNSSSLESFSGLIIEDTDSLPDGVTHLQLLSDKGEVLETREIVTGEKIVFEQLRPLAYRIRLLADENNNGQFDNGSFLHRRQPERLWYMPESVKLRANWEISVSLKELPKPW